MARVRRSGATGALTLRADSGFFSWELIKTLDRLEMTWSITAHQNNGVQRAIAAISEETGGDITYPDGEAAQVAETGLRHRRGTRPSDQASPALVVRRTRLTDPIQAQLRPDWRHYAFITISACPRLTPTGSTGPMPPSSWSSGT